MDFETEGPSGLRVNHHFFHAQYRKLAVDTHVMLYGGTWSYIQGFLMIVMPWILSQHAVYVEFNSTNTTIMLFASVFAGEILGCLVLVQYLLIKTCGEIYEQLMQSHNFSF